MSRSIRASGSAAQASSPDERFCSQGHLPRQGPPKGERLLLRQMGDLIASPEAAVGLIILFCLILTAVLAGWIAPQNPYDLMQLDIMDNMLPPVRNWAVA